MKEIQEEITVLAKAINKNQDLEIEIFNDDNNFFLQNQNIISQNKIRIPKTSSRIEFRALCDLAICYHFFHDKNIHNYEKNIEILSEDEQKFLDDFEKIRVISKMKNQYFGLTKNIINKIENDIDFILVNQGFASFQLLLLNEIFNDEKEQFLSENLQNILQSLTSLNQKEIVKKIQEIAKKIDNQKEFIDKTKNFLEFIKKNLKKDKEENQPNQESKEEKNSNKNQDNSINQENIESNSLEKNQENQEFEENKKEEYQSEINEISDLQISEENSSIKTKSSSSKFKEDKIEFIEQYKVFTNKFDEIILPSKLINKNELEILRQNLDLKIEKLQSISKKLTINLKKRLLAKQNVSIEQSENQGILDRKKLTQIICDPFERNHFIKIANHDYQNTIITILLDNSGSMRGLPIIMSALTCEILTNMLEKFAVKTEIIGFTTADWKGGKSKKLWEIQGKKRNCGRLNDLRHIIYKTANQNFKKSKINLGLMLKEGVLKENIDGEALLFAKSRLMQRSEKRKILMIISDGTPVDDSTNSNNDDKDILINHLNQVIKKIEKENKIELVGIGIGHNVGDFYKNSITIKNIDELGDVMIKKLTDLI